MDSELPATQASSQSEGELLSQIQTVDSDVETTDTVLNDLSPEFFQDKMSNIAEMFDNYRTTAAAWNESLPSHRFVNAFKSDLKEFVVLVTIAWSNVCTIAESLATGLQTFRTTLDDANAKLEEFGSQWSQLKSIAIPLLSNSDDDNDHSEPGSGSKRLRTD
jgi:hypothetical protein